jgi:hypothetical protein
MKTKTNQNIVNGWKRVFFFMTINFRFHSKKMGIEKELKLISSRISTLFCIVTIKVLEQKSVTKAENTRQTERQTDVSIESGSCAA